MGKFTFDLSYIGHELVVILALWAKGLASASYVSLSLVCGVFRVALIYSSSSNP